MAFLLIAACWLAAWPYKGLWHDARLYALEALARLDPGAFERDLFLMYGSQGKFTLFPGVFAWLVNELGLETAALTLTLAGKLLWLGALFVLARRLLSDRLAFLGFLLVLAYPAFYDSHKVFSYGESFATPRLYAEALTFLALAAWLRGRQVAALGLIAAAGLFHPLMALPGAALLGALRIAEPGRRPILWLALAAIGLLVAAVAVAPELREKLVAVYDPAWYAAVALRNPYVFLDQWKDIGWGRVIWLGIVLTIMTREGDTRLRRIALATLLVTATMLVLSWLGTSAWKHVLLTQLQLWRALWLAQVVALMLLPALLARLWKADYADRVLAASLAGGLFLDGWSTAALALGGAFLQGVFGRMGAKLDTRRLFWRVLPYLLVVPWMLVHVLQLPYWWLVSDFYLDKTVWRTILSDRLVMLALGLLVYWLLERSRATATVVPWLGAGVVLLVSILLWLPLGQQNRTAGWESIYEQLRQDIPPGRMVASTVQGGIYFIWFKLGRPSYVSQLQTAGALFNRETALEGVRRLRMMKRAGFPYADLDWSGKGAGQSISSVSIQSIATLCGDPVLDHVVMPGKWKQARHYYLNARPVLSIFSCRDFRSDRGMSLRPV